MATTFQRKGSAVIVTKGTEKVSIPVQAFIYQHPRDVNKIVISDDYSTQDEHSGYSVFVDDVIGIDFTDRADLIEKLTDSFFFNHTITTPLGGIAIRIINGTGAPTVKGSLVSVSPTQDNKFVLQANEYDTVGIVYEHGISDGNLCYVVVTGIAEVLFKNGIAVTRGQLAIAADTDGRAITIAVPSSNPVVGEHFKEIGHCMESKNAGVNVLAKCIIHFN